MGIYKKYFKRYWIQIVIALFCVAGEAGCDLLGPTIMAQVINKGIRTGDSKTVARLAGLMLFVCAVGCFFAVTRSLLSSRVSQRIGADLRSDLFAKVLRFSEPAADRIEPGSLITRMTNDTAQLVGFANGLMRIFLKAPITCIGSILLATTLNPRLSPVVYVAVGVITLLIVLSMKLSYPRYSRLQQRMDRINSVVQEYLAGVRLVKAFGTYEQESDRFEEANQGLTRQSISAQLVITLTSPLMSLTVGMATVTVVALGSNLFAQGHIEPGSISAFTVYMAQILGSLMMMTNIFNNFIRTKASAQRLREVLDSEEDFVGAAKSPGTVRGGITFSHVSFSYPTGSGLPALRDVSFSVEAGQTLAVIGPTGSGKSTLVWLLLRFYDPNEGVIRLDGRPLADYPIEDLRQAVALVPQQALLFRGTVAENLRWGDPAAEDSLLAEMANIAAADGFIEAMPEGYESMLGASGVNLSGGQRQRISIARGLLKRSPVLVLDDATSALDAVTEAKVRKAMDKPPRKQTRITVTQRCTTAMFADRILVLEGGRVAGFGSHDDLLRDCDVYRDIYRSQVDGSLEVTLHGR